MNMKSTLLLLVSRTLLGLGLFGLCGLAALFGAQRLPASAQSPSFVRIIHASPDVGTADVFVDGAKLLSSFQFGAITGYVSVPAGPHKVQIALVGKGIGGAVITETLAVSPGVAYTVAAVGTQATGLALKVFIDNNLLSPGTAKFRTYQLSPDGDTVTVSTGGKTVLSGLGYQGASNYLAIPKGGYTFNVTSPTNNTTLPIAATLNANSVTSVFVVGLFNGIPKVQLVAAQVTGLPGVPNTGSDPNPIPSVDHVQPLAPLTWLLLAVSLLFVGSGFFIRRVVVKQ
jgi:Domain of unknown function (DUF4397)